MALHPPVEGQPAPGQVMVAVSRGVFGAHIGLAFLNAAKEPTVLDLAWHRTIKSTELVKFAGGFCVTAPVGLDRTSLVILTGVLRRIAKRPPKIPYGVDFLSAIGSFDDQGNYSPPKGSKGLTCATFILEILRGLGFQVLLENTWPLGVNGEWVEQICQKLAEIHPPADAAHIQAVRADSSVARIRPEETAAALEIAAKEWPLAFSAIKDPAVAAMATVNKHCPVHQPTHSTSHAARLLFSGEPGPFGVH